jgi:hypothetical protein
VKYFNLAFAPIVSIVAAAICSTALAQQVSPPPVAVQSVPAPPAMPVAPTATAATQTISLPAGTDITLSLAEALTSKAAKVGYKFKFTTTADVAKDGHVFIPRGTLGEGTVIFQKGAGSFGKSGKIELEFNQLMLESKPIALTGKHRQEGKSKGGMAAGAVVAAGLIGGALVKGSAAEITTSQELRAQTVDVLTHTVPVETTSTPSVATTQPVSTAPVAAPVVPESAPANK